MKRQRIDIQEIEPASNQLKKREPQVRRGLRKSLTDVEEGEDFKLFVFVNKSIKHTMKTSQELRMLSSVALKCQVTIMILVKHLNI